MTVEVRFFVDAEEAEVAELEFDAIIGWGVAGSGAVCRGIDAVWGVMVGFRGMLLGD